MANTHRILKDDCQRRACKECEMTIGDDAYRRVATMFEIPSVQMYHTIINTITAVFTFTIQFPPSSPINPDQIPDGASLFAEISVSSPKKIYLLITFYIFFFRKKLFWRKVSKKYLIWF